MSNRTITLALGLALLVAASTLAAQSVPEALYFKFNEGSGTTTANDAFPGEGDPSYTLPSTATWGGPGPVGPATLDFAGSGSSYHTGWSTSFLDTDPWTIEYWQNITGTSSNYALGGGGGTGSFRFWQSGTTLYLRSIGGSLNTSIGIPGVARNVWTHVAVVYDPASGVTAYVDGTVAGTWAGTTAPVFADFLIGGRTLSDSFGHVGGMEELRFWLTART
jgi:hypothetical protein